MKQSRPEQEPKPLCSQLSAGPKSAQFEAALGGRLFGINPKHFMSDQTAFRVPR